MTGCLLAPFKILGFIFRAIWLGILWCFTNGIKGFVVGGFCILVIGFLLGTLHIGSSPSANTAHLSPGEPAITEAPYIVTQQASKFYATDVKIHGDDYILTPCWSLQGDKWVKFDTMRLTQAGGQVTVGKR